MSNKILSIGTYTIHNDLYPLLIESWKRGCRYVDTAPNYRSGNAHVELKQCLEKATLENIISSTKDIIISTKVGFIPKSQKDLLIKEGIIKEEDTYQFHNLSKKYIKYEINKTICLFNHCNIDTIFLHNPESQLSIKSYNEVLDLIKTGFECLEEYAYQGKITSYGIATWSAFDENNKVGYFSVLDFLKMAEAVGGQRHHFRAIQLPINLTMTSSIFQENEQRGPLWDAICNNLEVHVSSPLLGGKVIGTISPEISKIINPKLSIAQAALLFSRSHPAVTRLLVSPSTLDQLAEIFSLENIEDLATDELIKISHFVERKDF